MKCYICNKKICYAEIIATKEDMRWDCFGKEKFIIKCPHCNTVQLIPQWTEKELDELYNGYTNQKDFPWQKQAKRITKYLLKYVKDDNFILEVGSGKGENVKFLSDKGYMIEGIDKDPTYCDEIYTKHKDFKDLHGRWDFIYAIQVFEHINNPIEFINKILELLLPKGRFLLEIPNLEDPILSLYHNKAFEKYYYIPHHLYFWTPETIKILFDKSDIKIKIKLLQKYGILNHLRWAIFKVPGNWHPHIPILDNIYKLILTRIFKKSDTLIIIGERKNKSNE